jgi:hypothetical protein
MHPGDVVREEFMAPRNHRAAAFLAEHVTVGEPNSQVRPRPLRRGLRRGAISMKARPTRSNR